MDNEEIVELFFSKYNERIYNEKILEDCNFVIPREMLLNYIRNVIQVPFNDFVSYVVEHTDEDFEPFELEEIPMFYNLMDCRERMIDLMLMEDNRGLRTMEIGSFIKTRSISMNPGYSIVGKKNVFASETMGIVFEYYNHWYLNCVAYVFDELSSHEIQAFYSRAILRNKFVQVLLTQCLQGSISIIYDLIFDPYSEISLSLLRSIEYWYTSIEKFICKPYHLHEVEEIEELHKREEKKVMNAVRGDLWSRKTDFDISTYIDEVCVAEVDLNDPLAYEPKDPMGNPLVLVKMPDGRWAKSYAYLDYSRDVPSMVDTDGYYRMGPLPDFNREIALLLKEKESSAGIHNKMKMDALIRSQMLDFIENNIREYESSEGDTPMSNIEHQQSNCEKELFLKLEELAQVPIDDQDKRQEIQKDIKRLSQSQSYEKSALEYETRKREEEEKRETERKERLQKRLEEYKKRLERKKQVLLQREQEKIKRQQLAEKRTKERAEKERVQAEQRAREKKEKQRKERGYKKGAKIKSQQEKYKMELERLRELDKELTENSTHDNYSSNLQKTNDDKSNQMVATQMCISPQNKSNREGFLSYLAKHSEAQSSTTTLTVLEDSKVVELLRMLSDQVVYDMYDITDIETLDDVRNTLNSSRDFKLLSFKTGHDLKVALFKYHCFLRQHGQQDSKATDQTPLGKS